MATPRTENSTTRTDWTLNGTNREFDLTYVPIHWSVQAVLNGDLVESTTVSGSSTVTLDTAPESGDYLVIFYVEFSGVASDATVLGVANLALIRLGKKPLTTLGDGSTVATAILSIWDYVRDEVLQARDWRFAKTRVALVVSATAPLYTYDYAYALPDDFLRLCANRGNAYNLRNPASLNTGMEYYLSMPTTNALLTNYDPPVYPPGMPYVIETLPADGALFLLTNYDNTYDDLYINYIRRVTDANLYTATFNSCLAFRLAQELAVILTEDDARSNKMEELYEKALRKASSVNESVDSVDEESGADSWEFAGR